MKQFCLFMYFLSIYILLDQKGNPCLTKNYDFQGCVVRSSSLVLVEFYILWTRNISFFKPGGFWWQWLLILGIRGGIFDVCQSLSITDCMLVILTKTKSKAEHRCKCSTHQNIIWLIIELSALFLPPGAAASVASSGDSSTQPPVRRRSFVGTAQYVSPEVLTSKEAYFSSDLWALGCIVYQLMSGQLPFWGG